MQTDKPSRNNSVRWGLVSPGGLIWRSWGDAEAVVYHTDSGDTHLVNRVTAEVLQLLERSEQNPDELARVLAQRLETEFHDELVGEVEQLLSHLERIGLAEPVG